MATLEELKYSQKTIREIIKAKYKYNMQKNVVNKLNEISVLMTSFIGCFNGNMDKLIETLSDEVEF